MALPGKSSAVLKKIVKSLVAITCDGEHVSSLYGCVSDDGVVCSDHGSCKNHTCTCDAGYTGIYCEKASGSSSSNTGTIIGIVLGISPRERRHHTTMCLVWVSTNYRWTGVVIPIVVLVLLVIAGVCIATLVLRKRNDETWEIGTSAGYP